MRPTIGPESVLPVKGRLPPLAVVPLVGAGAEVEPRSPVGTVVEGATVEPSPVIGVLDTVVDVGTVVVASTSVEVVVGSVVVVVDSVVLVVEAVELVVDVDVLVDVVSDGEHCEVRSTDVATSFAWLSGHCPNTSSTTLPVRLPGTVVVALIVAVGGHAGSHRADDGELLAAVERRGRGDDLHCRAECWCSRSST